MRNKKLATILLATVTMLSVVFSGCALSGGNAQVVSEQNSELLEEVKEAASHIDVSELSEDSSGTRHSEATYSVDQLPEYTGNAVDVVNENIPFFAESDYEAGAKSFLILSDLDELGRCGQAYMCVTADTMPGDGEERGAIGNVKPSGWNQAKYPEVIEESPSYLYNRAHLLAWCLSGLNDEERNLITGTRYFNVTAMLPYEEEIARYVEDTGENVLYRVTPVYNGDELIARGVVMEAHSVTSDGLHFCVYAHNVQPGIEINYADGSSYVSGEEAKMTDTETNAIGISEASYIGNKNSKVFHTADCDSVAKMSTKNMVGFVDREAAIADGYTPCGNCNP